MTALPFGNAHILKLSLGKHSTVRLRMFYSYEMIPIIYNNGNVRKAKNVFRLHFLPLLWKLLPAWHFERSLLENMGGSPFCAPSHLRWVAIDMITVNHLRYKRHNNFGANWVPSQSPPCVMYQGLLGKTSTMSYRVKVQAWLGEAYKSRTIRRDEACGTCILFIPWR